MSDTPSPGDAIRAEPSPHCIVCGQAGVKLYEGLTDYLAGTPGQWRMVRCADPACGLLWLDPKPLASDLIKAYATYHTHGVARSRNLSRLWLSAVNTACKLLCHLLEAASALGRQRRALRTMYIGNATPGALLEVGSGSGRFLARMRDAGWTVEGVEFDPVAAARVRRKYGIPVAVGDLPELGYPAGQYDVIAMSQVIEHVPDPVALLRECHRLLRAGGRLVLSTPNPRGLPHRLYGRHWRGLEPPRHQHLFTSAALRRCAIDAGFRDLRSLTLSAESAGIYRASARLRDDAGPETAAVLRSWWLRYREYRASLRDPEAGEDLFLIAVK
jgi:SAM-dependent methyltransferase